MARWPLPFSPHCRPAGSRRLNLSHSASCCADASDSQSPSPLARADVAANLTLLATIALRAQEREFLGRRGFALEVAAAQVCREAGPRVSTNQFVRDLDLGEFNGLDGRRLEVIADGLSLWRGAQLAIDTTLVSPLHRDGTARRGAADRNGVTLDAARRKKERAYPKLSGDEGRARLVVLAAEVGGRWSNETAQFLIFFF